MKKILLISIILTSCSINDNLSNMNSNLNPENLFDLSLMPAEIYHLEKIPSVINSADIILITIFSIILVFISSIYPAMQASSIRPSIILRGNN